MKRQAEAELARARSEAEAGRAAKRKAEVDAAAARTRAQAEADAARIRADAQAAAARTKPSPEVTAPPARDAIASAPVALAHDNKSSPTPPAGTDRFDGLWNVTIDCANMDNALGYTFDFVASVKNGFLQDGRGSEGAPASVQLSGKIQPDGSAKLDAKGVTADPRYTAKNLQPGSPYAYSVIAQFEGSRGKGRRVQVRPCDLTFAKQ